MADIPISSLTEVTSADADDDLVIETASGTRRISRQNNLPRRNELTTFTAANINLLNDEITFFDGTDNLLKAIAFFDAIFGNYSTLGVTDDFTLDPAIHNGRPIEMRTTFTSGEITLDGNVADIGGATFFLNNFTPNDLTLLTANGITLFVDGASAATATIRENTSCTIQLNSVGDEAIFSGG